MSRAGWTEEIAPPLAELYNRDFHAWCVRIAELCATGRTEELDIAHLREEIASLAARDEREVISRMKRILRHLLRLEYQPGKRTKSWEMTLLNQRSELASLFGQSPSLAAFAQRNVSKAYQLARRLAAIDTALPVASFPEQCPYSSGQIQDAEFVPLR